MSAVVVLQALTLTLPMNLVGCGLNDIYDYESDRRSGRRLKVWGAVVRAEDRPLVWRGVIAMVPLIVAGAFATRNDWNIAATCGMLMSAWAYSVPPLRLKERPPLDSLANGLGYFLLPFAMGYSLGANPLAMPLKYYLLALCVGGIHALASAADYEADRTANHRTLAVRFGRRTATFVALASFGVAIWYGDFRGLAVQAFLLTGFVASLTATLWPRERVIEMACVAVFVGFLIAAICHVAGL
jgi:4-hydroxybenzoate polyprenyltransferase